MAVSVVGTEADKRVQSSEARVPAWQESFGPGSETLSE